VYRRAALPCAIPETRRHTHLILSVKGTFPLMKKRRSFIRRVPALLILAAGVGVAVMASREDGREKLAQFGEFVGKRAESFGIVFGNARQFVSDYAEQMQSRNAASYPSTPGAYQMPLRQPDGYQRQSEYTPSH
jgi:hypothetical protein